MVLVMGGCSVTPEPEETTPAFATEEEAFAAAEQTYRAYVDAVNERRADQDPSPAPEDFLTGVALQDEVDSARQLSERGWSIHGENVLAETAPVRAETPYDSIEMWACIDVSKTTVRDETDADITPPDRSERIPITIELTLVGTTYLISRTAGADDTEC